MTKAGGSKAAHVKRRAQFVRAYLANGHNATQAAISAGYAEKSAHVTGARLLRHAKVAGELADAARLTLEKADISAESVLREVAGMALGEVDKPLTHEVKLKALDMLCRHLGLFKEDNSQKGESVEVRLLLVGPRDGD